MVSLMHSEEKGIWVGFALLAGLEMPFLHESCTYTRGWCPVGASSDTFCLARKFWGRDVIGGNEGSIFNFFIWIYCLNVIFISSVQSMNQPCVYIWPLCLNFGSLRPKLLLWPLNTWGILSLGSRPPPYGPDWSFFRSLPSTAGLGAWRCR